MPTITASPGLVYLATDTVTDMSSTTNPDGNGINTWYRLWYWTYDTSSSTGVQQNNSTANVYFKNALGQTLLTRNLSSGFTRTMSANGYCVFSMNDSVVPSVSGTIAYIEIDHATATNYGLTGFYQLADKVKTVLTVGAIGSGADVEIDNRDLTTTQPWRLDGSIRFRVPNTFTYSL